MKRLVLLALVAVSLVIASTVSAAGPGNGNPSDEYDQVIADKVDRLAISSAESVAALAGA